jgi:hypothetical protein
LKLAPAALALLLVLPASAQEPLGAFEQSEWRVPGRVVDAFAVRGEDGRDTVFTISLQGSPPEEVRRLTSLPRDLEEPARPSEVPREVVTLDVAELGLAPGPEIVWLSAGELRIRSLRGELLRAERIEPPLPLPPRTWELARVELARDWDGDGRPEVLAPTGSGFRLLPVVAGDVSQELRVPVVADYGSPTLENYFRPGQLVATTYWPSVALADDDGDGRDDLFIFDRYRLSVFRAGPAGLPPTPSRMRAFPPFSPEEERRHLASTLLGSVRDIDGDGRADLVVHRMVGELARSRATTTVHLNRGDGADPAAAPDVRIERSGGNSAVRLDDVDGDGRLELLEAYVGFGVVQAIRMLTLQSAELRLRVLRLPDAGSTLARETWSDDVSYPFDFTTTRVRGVLPFSEADWNADGRCDLVWADGSGLLRLRLGEANGKGPRFGPVAASASLPISGEVLAADVDHDGLPDFVAWDPLDLEGRLRIGRNRGALPGTRPSLRRQDRD